MANTEHGNVQYARCPCIVFLILNIIGNHLRVYQTEQPQRKWYFRK